MTFAGELADSYRETGATELLVERRSYPSEPRTQSKARLTLLDDMIVSRGDGKDWELLHSLHYKAEGLPLGANYWKTTLYGETIGCLVTGVPKGLLKERHVAFPRLKPRSGDTKIVNTQRYVFINANFRVVGRFVFDTMYRGIGCGYRMMNLVARMQGTPYCEIQSSMAKFNHFGQKAGFRFVNPMNSIKFAVGIKFFRENFSASPQDFEAIVNELTGKTGLEREKLIHECRAFYYRHSILEKTGIHKGKGMTRIDGLSDHELIRNIQQMVLASPMYGLYANPDAGRQLPQELPLTAFDNQKTDEPLRLQ